MKTIIIIIFNFLNFGCFFSFMSLGLLFLWHGCKVLNGVDDNNDRMKMASTKDFRTQKRQNDKCPEKKKDQKSLQSWFKLFPNR